MHRLLLGTLAMMALASAGGAQDVDIRRINKNRVGPPTEVLVLGTMHLSDLPESFKPEFLEPLLERLQRFRPDIITIEALSGPDCEGLRRHVALYPGVADHYCWDPAPAERATGLSVPAAVAEVAKLLGTWPATPTAGQRRNLAATFLAANDRWSALVQWLRLPERERRAGDGLDDALVAVLDKAVQARNEDAQIAAVLAARLGLERLHPTDDHSADSVIATLGKDYAAALRAVVASSNLPARTICGVAAPVRAIPLKSGAETLACYRELNGADVLQLFVDYEFGLMLGDPSPQRFGRQYVAWWEVRNLRMVANIRAAFGNRPGARVLSIVGSSHKPYFDAYFGMMHDVRLIDVQAVLK